MPQFEKIIITTGKENRDHYRTPEKTTENTCYLFHKKCLAPVKSQIKKSVFKDHNGHKLRITPLYF